MEGRANLIYRSLKMITSLDHSLRYRFISILLVSFNWFVSKDVIAKFSQCVLQVNVT